MAARRRRPWSTRSPARSSRAAVPVVTALRATRHGRIAVHVDGEFACAVSEAAVARWRLHAGRELSQHDLERLRSDASAELALADAYRLLGHRSRSTQELRRRLLAKGHEERAVEDALSALTVRGHVDDADFARRFVADKRGLAGWGEQRIRRALQELGVEAVVVEAALDAGPAGEADDPELERASAALERRGAPKPPLDAARRRAYQSLLRRGFAPSVAYAAVRRWSGAGPGGATD
jgi:regulatory protein